MNNLILGTAQFGSGYGVTNKRGTLSQKEINKIISKSFKLKIKYIETSYNYKNVIKKISKNKNKKKFKYIFKIHMSEIKKFEVNSIVKLIEYQKNILGVKKFEYFLIQNFDKYFNNKKLLNKIKNINFILKEKKIISKFGISSYKFYKLNFLKEVGVEAIQLPFSIFDQRLINNNYHKELNKKKIKIFVRSIFLQGLLLENYKNINNYFSKYKKYFIKFYNFCKKKKISQIKACLNFVKNYKEINGVIFGVLSEKELLEIINNYFSKKIKIKFSKVNENKLIDISKWQLKKK